MKPAILSRGAFAAAASLAVVAPLAGCTGADTSSSASSQPSRTSPANSAPATSSPGAPSSGAEYQDGTYTVRGDYGGAPSYMTITVTLSDDTITDVTVEPMPENNDTSRGYQERFAAAVPDEVIGKSLDDAEVGVIAGASGCAEGFNDAIAKIREQAGASS
jgi:uncharacterized protein with FMN-binding domain